MAVGDIISAARYNQVQGRVSAILGVGSGTKGYNQTVQSSPVAVGGKVFATDMNKLYNDAVKIYAHQNGSVPTSIFSVSTEDDITDALFVAHENIIAAAEADPQRFVVDASQADLESAGINSSRSSLWGGTSTPQAVIHEFTATFSSSDNRRAFFNAGGEIRLQLSLTHSLAPGNADYAKTNDWKNMLAAIGTVKFSYNRTIATSGGPGSTNSNIGNFQLSGSYQQVYKKIGSGVYLDNDVVVEAREISSTKIGFRITFTDDAVGSDPGGFGPVDERVNGNLVSAVSQYRPEGSYVDVPAPVWQNTITLDSNTTPVPTPVSADTTVVIAVVDESSSQSASTMATKWQLYTARYPDRKFWLLQPGTSTDAAALRVPAQFTSDVESYGPVAVNRDQGIVAQASDWYTITDMNLLSPGDVVGLSIDNSGSMTLATVQASYNLFKQNCATAGITVKEYTMNNEDWITPFDRIIS